jgi:hypothetical protein
MITLKDAPQVNLPLAFDVIQTQQQQQQGSTPVQAGGF